MNSTFWVDIYDGESEYYEIEMSGKGLANHMATNGSIRSTWTPGFVRTSQLAIF